MSTPFQFKQFTIQQNLCAMKVGTDSVLLGAWSTSTGNNILDIGSGTGIITIMIAQRNQKSLIDTIDINKNAYLQTIKNVESCKWKTRINVTHSSLQEFETNKKYDLIITNPPYFNSSTKSPQQERNTARHTDTLSYHNLLLFVKKHLSHNGVFSLILPTKEANIFIYETQKISLFLIRKCSVKPNPLKLAKRVLMEFSFQKKKLILEELTIETQIRHHYSKEYILLTKDFYLNF